MPKFSEELESRLTPYRDEYRLVVNGWLAGGTFGVTYPALLVETFHYVKHSCSLMSQACARLGHDALPLQTYFAQHIAEEVGHEEWVLDDLEALGYDRREVEASRPLPETVSLIGSQLYVIDYLHPAGLLGYVYLMESTPPNELSLAFLEAYGIGPRATTFLRRHGETDQRHSRELREMLDLHFREPRLREAATLSAVIGLSCINRLLRRVRSGNYVDHFPETTVPAPPTFQSQPPPLNPALPQRPPAKAGQ
jgi:hypothetical protein